MTTRDDTPASGAQEAEREVTDEIVEIDEVAEAAVDTSGDLRRAEPATMPSSAPPRSVLLHDASMLVAYLRQRLPPVAEPVAPSARVREAAVLIPLYARAGRPHLLLTLRSPSLRFHSGEMSFPGGGREPDDASLVATALRETEEELALPASRVEILGSLAAINTVVSNNWVVPVVGWLGEGLPPLQPAPDEVAEIVEAPLEALADPAIFHAEEWQRGNIARSIFFYDLGPYRIWGLTGWMLTTLLGLLPPA